MELGWEEGSRGGNRTLKGCCDRANGGEAGVRSPNQVTGLGTESRTGILESVALGVASLSTCPLRMAAGGLATITALG